MGGPVQESSRRSHCPGDPCATGPDPRSGDNVCVKTRDVARYWESNARAWTTLSRQGWDVYRDSLNTPAFLALLPEIGGGSGLDIGCGEGHNTRLLAARGAQMAGVDLVPTFIESAREAERETPLGAAVPSPPR